MKQLRIPADSTWRSRPNRFFDFANVFLKQRILFKEIVVNDAHRTLKETSEVCQDTAFPPTLG